MKVVITKEEFATLDPLFQAEYKEVDGSFILNADGIDNHPDVKALKGAYTGEKDKRTAAAKRLEELEAAKKLADEATLTEQQKFKELSELKAKEATDSATALEALRAEVLNGKIDSEASEIATLINKTDATRQYFLRGELKNYIKNGDDGLFYQDKTGAVLDRKSLITKIETEFPLLKSGNPASGGGAPGNPGHQAPKTEPGTSLEAVTQAFSGALGKG